MTLDEVLDRLEDLDDQGDDQHLRDELERALAAFPDARELREWEASVAVDDERYEDAIAILDRLLADDPADLWARRERAGVLIDLGRFGEALAQLRALPDRERRRLERGERASLHYDLGLCLDRLGRSAEADGEFRRAARLDRDQFPVPLRLSQQRFASLVAEALDEIPTAFVRYLDQLVVRVRDYPGPNDASPFLLGLYVGVSLPERTVAMQDHLDHILVFKRPHELRSADDAALREEVRGTVIHEVAHHFGLEHAEMGDYR